MDSSNNFALRTRRTVPLHATEDDDDDTYVHVSRKLSGAGNSISSSNRKSRRAISQNDPTTPSSSKRSSSSDKFEGRTRKNTPPQRVSSSVSFQNSIKSYDSRNNSYTDAIMTPRSKERRSRYSGSLSIPRTLSQSEKPYSTSEDYQQQSTRSKLSSGIRTPSSSSASKKLTIGPDCGLGSSRSCIWNNFGSISSSAASNDLPDLFSMEYAFSLGGSLADDSQSRRDIIHGRNPNLTSTPVAWKTPFEVDAPREPTNSFSNRTISYRPSAPSQASIVSEPATVDPRLSEEQDAWAGIDALLEIKSLNDSFEFSTRDILPSSTVKAMRRDDDTSVVIDDDASEYSETPYAALRMKIPARKLRHENDLPNSMGSLDQDMKPVGGTIVSSGAGTLFDVFHWSQKENVDDLRQRKVKLNTRRVHLQMNSQPDDADLASLPSLATCREEELSTRSEISDWLSLDDKGSIVTEDFLSVHKKSAEKEVQQTKPDAPLPAIPHSIGGSDVAATGPVCSGKLVLDKTVDAYIRKMQKKLPTISENGSRRNMNGKRAERIVECEEHQATFDNHSLEELPSLSSFSNGSVGSSRNDSGQRAASYRRKKEEKDFRDPSASLSSKFLKSFKGMRGPKTSKAQNKGLVSGDEQKYFPDAAKQDNSKRFNANRCLLNENEEEANIC